MKRSISTTFAALCFCWLQAGAQEIPRWKAADLKKAIAEAKVPTVFNFWATFCAPCIEEMPYFQELAEKYKAEGLQLVLVNLDMAATYSKIGSFAKRFNISAPIVFLDETNADIFCPIVDPKWSGAIPASLFVNNPIGYRKFYEDQLQKEELEVEILRLLGKQQ